MLSNYPTPYLCTSFKPAPVPVLYQVVNKNPGSDRIKVFPLSSIFSSADTVGNSKGKYSVRYGGVGKYYILHI